MSCDKTVFERGIHGAPAEALRQALKALAGLSFWIAWTADPDLYPEIPVSARCMRDAATALHKAARLLDAAADRDRGPGTVHVNPAHVVQSSTLSDHHLPKVRWMSMPMTRRMRASSSVKVTGAEGNTTPTDPRSRRNRASRRGGQLLTRARSSSNGSACPHLRAPGASVPDGRTIGQTPKNQARDSATDIFIPDTNLLERLFVEERRRLKIIPNAFGEKAVLKLMFGAMIRAAERWRAIKVSELERRQMRAVREELDREYEAPNGLGEKTSASARHAKISSTAQT